jgi:glycosyltransferase involved in cell wall biosynthesis
MSERDLKVLFVSTWLPKPCGIATYSQALVGGMTAARPTTDCRVVALQDPGDAFAYPPLVRRQVDREDLIGLRRTAAYVNACGADVVSLQHEFGIWGGFDGELILPFLDRLRVPVVATLHAVPLARPSAFNRLNRLRLLVEIGRRVERLVVFLPAARDYLVETLGLPPGRVLVVPHGAPAYDRAQRPAARARLDVDGRVVLTTFGLLNRFKGIEDVLRALPALVADCPETLYLVLGRPHPYEPADFYPALRTLAAELGVAEHVRFVDRFLEDDELADALLATDIYLTPYHDLAQVSSGTLTFALSAGCCCVSTPYLYARHVLAEGRGVLVPPGEPAALAAALRPLLADPARRATYAEAAAAYGARLHWSHIGQQYLDIFGAVARPLPPGPWLNSNEQ